MAELTEKDIQFNKSTAMWKGVMLKDMTREEMINAFWEMGQYYESRLKEKYD